MMFKEMVKIGGDWLRMKLKSNEKRSSVCTLEEHGLSEADLYRAWITS